MSATVLLVEDHNVMREALRNLLQKNPELEVVGEAATGSEAVELASRLSPDLVIMDVTMPGLDGMAATQQIVSECCNVKVIGLSMHTERQYVLGMLRAGAAAYLMKDCSFEELNAAIETVLAGGTYITKRAAQIVMEALHGGEALDSEEPAAVEMLTSREREILKLIAQASKSEEIADILRISPRTVYAHRRNIMVKLGARNLADLTRFAIENGLVTLSKSL